MADVDTDADYEGDHRGSDRTDTSMSLQKVSVPHRTSMFKIDGIDLLDTAF